MKLKSGFSLIELLVVVAIIGILAAIGSVGYNKYIAQATTAASTANDKQILEAVIADDASQAAQECNGTAVACATQLAAANNVTISPVTCTAGRLTIGSSSGPIQRLGC